jgi:hypothetical protein
VVVLLPDFVKFAVERSHLVLEILDKKLEIFLFLLLLNCCFWNTFVICLIKYLLGHKLSLDSIFIVSLTRVFTGIDNYFRCDP